MRFNIQSLVRELYIKMNRKLGVKINFQSKNATENWMDEIYTDFFCDWYFVLNFFPNFAWTIQISNKCMVPLVSFKITTMNLNLSLKLNFKLKLNVNLNLNLSLKLSLTLKLNLDLNLNLRLNLNLKLNLNLNLNLRLTLNLKLKLNLSSKLFLKLYFHFDLKFV